MISIVLFWLTLFSVSCLVASYGKKVEKILPVTTMAGLVWLFLCGIIGSLNLGFYTIVFATVVAWILLGCRLVNGKDNRRVFRENCSGSVLAPIMLMFMFFLWCDWGMMAGNTSDEFTHWIYIVKEMVRLNKFGTVSDANAMFASYPPGLALIQYFLEKLNLLVSDNYFSEWRSFYAYHILMITMFFPFLQRGKKVFSIISMGICFLLPTCFYMTYHDLTPEPIIAVMTGCAFARIYIEKEKDMLYHLYICLICASLALMKDSGMLFAFFVCLAYFVDGMLFSNVKTGVRKWCRILVCFCFTIIPKVLWNIELTVTKANAQFPSTVDVSVLLDVLLGKDTSYRAVTWEKFVDSIFINIIYIQNPWTDSSALQPNWFSLSCFQLVFVFFVIWLIIIRLWTKKNGADEKKRLYALMGVFFALLVVYVLGVGVTYLTNFSEYEATILAGFSIYTQVPYLSCFVIIILVAIDILKDSKYDLRLGITVLFCIVMLISPKINAWNYVSREYVENSVSRREAYFDLCGKIAFTCTSDDKVCFINQEQWLYPYVAIRYEVRPVCLDLIGDFSTWYISETSTYYDEKTFFDSVSLKYDYLAIYKPDEFFVKMYSNLFEDEIEPNSLYRVNREKRIFEKIY